MLHNDVNNAIGKLLGIGFKVAAVETVEDPNSSVRTTTNSEDTTPVRPNRVILRKLNFQLVG